MTDTLPIVEWLSVIKGEYLDGFVKHGGSAIKFAVPASEDLGTLLRNALSDTALDLGYQVVTVDSGETRVHMPQDILFRIAEQIDWRLLARKVVLRIAKDAGFRTDNIDPRSEPSIVSAISAVSSDKESIVRLELRRELRKALPGLVFDNRNMARDFRVAMTQLCLSEVTTTGENQEAIPLIEWLTGVNEKVSIVKGYGIYNKVLRTNAKHLLESLLYWIRFAGYSGTVVLLNNSRVTLRRNPRDGLRFYSRSAVMDHYELLRELIDGTDRLEGLFLVVLSNLDFLDDDQRGKGFSIYRALLGRIADDVWVRNQVNPMAILVRLADTAQ